MEESMRSGSVNGLKAKSNKSGELELLRFVMCIVILFFHMNKHMLKHAPFPGSKWGFFLDGVVGVEFFFVCSGFLMAASAAREYRIHPLPDDRMLGESTSSFIYRKIMAFFPYHVLAFALAWATHLVTDWHGVKWAVTYTFDCIPSFFLIHMSGWKMANPSYVEWYLSVMILGMLILFPIIRKHFHVFTRVIAPVAGILLLGYMFQHYEKLGGVKLWSGLTFKAMIRGVAELCLGAFTYGLVLIIKDKIRVEKLRVLNTVIYIGGILGFLVFTCYKAPLRYQYLAVPACMVLVAVCFLGGTCLREKLNHPVVMFLGRFSLPLYLSQVIGIEIANMKVFKKCLGPWPRIAIAVALSLVTAGIVMLVGDRIGLAIKKRKQSEK